MLELLICKIDANQLSFEVIDNIFDRFYAVNKIDALLFFLGIVKYLRNISPKKIRFIIDASLLATFKDGEKTIESKIDYQEVLFLHLANISNLDRFKPILFESYKALVINNLVNDELLISFALEFHIVSGNNDLKNFFDLNGRSFNSEYTLILELVIKIINGADYFECLKEFKLIYPDCIHKTYSSPFNQNIFFNSNKFNWCLSYMLTRDSKYSLYDLYTDLVKNNLTLTDLLASARQKSVRLDLDFILKSDYYTKNDKDFKKFYNVLKTTYSSVPVNIMGKVKKQVQKNLNEKFYDKFYRSVSNLKFKK